MNAWESYLVPAAAVAGWGRGRAELLIERQIQLEDVDARLAQEAEIARLGAVLDDRADAVLGHVAGMGDARAPARARPRAVDRDRARWPRR